MNAWLLNSCGGMVLAGALVSGFKKSGRKHETFAEIPARVTGRTSQERLADPDLDGKIPLTRTQKSSRIDISMASRFRKSGVVDVGGHVAKPGPITFKAGMTIWAAIQGAGGATEFGAIKRVKLIRDEKIRIFDLTADEWLDLPVLPDDVIEVPQKYWLGR